jgi:hypothetical protein
MAKVQKDRTILLHPGRLVDADEAFFYTPTWQAAEREADEDIRTGHTRRFDNAAAAIDFLHDRDRGATAPGSCPPRGAA